MMKKPLTSKKFTHFTFNIILSYRISYVLSLAFAAPSHLCRYILPNAEHSRMKCSVEEFEYRQEANECNNWLCGCTLGDIDKQSV